MVGPARKRAAVEWILERFPEVSERRACRIVGQYRSTQRYAALPGSGDADLARELRRLSGKHPYWGYKSAYRELRQRGWLVNRKRVERVWRDQGLKAHTRRRAAKKAGGSAANAIWNLPAEHPNHVWALDFIGERLSTGRPYRVLNVIDEYTRRGLASIVDTTIGARRVQQELEALFKVYGRPGIIRTDNGTEFVAQTLAEWLVDQGVDPRPVEKASPQQNALIETYHRTMRRELLNWESFDTILESRVVINAWRDRYNTQRAHSSLSGKTPLQYFKEYKPLNPTPEP
jgi:putative transposase